MLIAAAIALFLFGKSCGVKSVLKTVGTVKTVTKDSIEYRDSLIPVPYRVDVPVYVKGKDGNPYPVYDTLWGTVIEPADTVAILARFYETAHYKHEIDTGRWKITVTESVTQNRIKDWSLKAVSSDTTTVNTVQLKPQKNFVGYWTLSGMGNVKNPFGGAGFGLGLKTPGETVYQAELKYLEVVSKNRIYGEIRVMIPIRLTKKK